MSKKTPNYITNNLWKEIRSLAFLSGKKELYSELNSLDCCLDSNFDTFFGPLGDLNQNYDVGFRWRSTNTDWKRALLLKQQMKAVGHYLKIQKQYSIPAKTKNRVVWKKYKGLNWDKFGSPDYSVIYFEVPRVIMTDVKNKEAAE